MEFMLNSLRKGLFLPDRLLKSQGFLRTFWLKLKPLPIFNNPMHPLVFRTKKAAFRNGSRLSLYYFTKLCSCQTPQRFRFNLHLKPYPSATDLNCFLSFCANINYCFKLFLHTNGGTPSFDITRNFCYFFGRNHFQFLFIKYFCSQLQIKFLVNRYNTNIICL